LELALARIKSNLDQIRGPVQRTAQEGLRRTVPRLANVAHVRHGLAAAMVLAIVGIAINALLLQRERHPAPLFGYASPRAPVAAPALPAPAPTPPSPPKAANVEDDAPQASLPATLPPARPQEPAQSAGSASDPIAELLTGKTSSDSSHLTLAAQTALAKLGYSVKPDGKEGAATEQALREFEHAHGLPPATEITERLVKQLTQAARNAGR
jgi:hypothetical protein